MTTDLAPHAPQVQSLKFRPFIDTEKPCLNETIFFLYFLENTIKVTILNFCNSREIASTKSHLATHLVQFDAPQHQHSCAELWSRRTITHIATSHSKLSATTVKKRIKCFMGKMPLENNATKQNTTLADAESILAGSNMRKLCSTGLFKCAG